MGEIFFGANPDGKDDEGDPVGDQHDDQLILDVESIPCMPEAGDDDGKKQGHEEEVDNYGPEEIMSRSKNAAGLHKDARLAKVNSGLNGDAHQGVDHQVGEEEDGLKARGHPMGVLRVPGALLLHLLLFPGSHEPKRGSADHVRSQHAGENQGHEDEEEVAAGKIILVETVEGGEKEEEEAGEGGNEGPNREAGAKGLPPHVQEEEGDGDQEDDAVEGEDDDG